MSHSSKKVHYERLDPISHILRRPDTYVGGLKSSTKSRIYLASTEEDSTVYNRIQEYTDVEISEALDRIFIEPLSNAIDNVWRSKEHHLQPTQLKIEIDEDTGRTRFWNDGFHIPIEKHATENMYTPELIFGHLMSGSNLDDTQQRLSSGRNGLGIKLTNVFSTWFAIELYDPDQQLIYTQEWSNNMRDRKDPRIVPYKPRNNKKSSTMGYCQITYDPDWSRFGYTEKKYPLSMMRLFAKRCMDAAMITGLPIVLNGKTYKCPQLVDYAQWYGLCPKQMIRLVHNEDGNEESHKKTSIVITPSFTLHEDDGRHIAFVNGIETPEGGVHVDSVIQHLLTALHPKFSKQGISIRDLRPYFTIFIDAWIPNPTFSSQSKTRLLSPSLDMIPIQPKHITAMMKWPFVEKMKELVQTRQWLSLKKTEKKTKKFKAIDGFDPANLAGGKKSNECTLILCEGLSAKTYATKGIAKGWLGKRGRDYFGIYPLRGKLLNVRNAAIKQISQNKEIADIIQILGLRHQVDYTDPQVFQTVTYGRILIITDADEDGHHICALLLNCFHRLFPSLLQRSVAFLYSMMTPIATIESASHGLVQYYSDFEYQKALDHWKRESPHIRLHIKYYKGLGTSTDTDIAKTFGQKVVGFQMDDQTDFLMDQIFHKQYANERKTWLTTYDPSVYRTPTENYPISQFLCQELITFSIGDCRRNIPCLYDSLKPSQRKILFAVFRKHLPPQGKSMKVAQLAGYCAEVSNYHHGEQCLHETIVRMCQTYPGSNNVPLLAKDGQFGSRAYLGKDAASARYIFTKCTPWTRQLFPVEDDDLLSYTLDDGDRVEPDFYLPILPLTLINGCTAGIGTGWSCTIPCFHPRRILTTIRAWLHDSEMDIDTMADAVGEPYYQGFEGRFEKLDNHRYMCYGIMTLCPPTTKKGQGRRRFDITELPIGIATQKYKTELEAMVETKRLKSLQNYSTPDTVHFVIEPADDFEPTYQNMNLTSIISLTNMVLFVEDYRLQKFTSIGEILHVYCTKRLALFETRRQSRMQQLRQEIEDLCERRRFLQEVDQQTIQLFRVSEDTVRQMLTDRHYVRIDALLKIPLSDCTQTKMTQLDRRIEQLRQTLATLEIQTSASLWLEALERIEPLLDTMTTV